MTGRGGATLKPCEQSSSLDLALTRFRLLHSSSSLTSGPLLFLPLVLYAKVGQSLDVLSGNPTLCTTIMVDANSKQSFVLLLGTCDTKLSQLVYVRSCVLQHGIGVKLMDVGRAPISHQDIDYTQAQVLSRLSEQPQLDSMDRRQVIETMISAASSLVTELYSCRTIAGAICIGGSGGTSLGASVMRSVLPIGFPKLLVSTVASGNVRNFVGETDITMMHSVVDVAGENSVLNPILENAAGMIAGAAKAYQNRLGEDKKRNGSDEKRKKSVAITMFGVTTPAVDAARAHLERNGYEVFVFHATGVGGRAMETLISQHRIDGVLDLTTTELADELVGGIMNAGPNRLTAAARTGVPQVVSLGGLDMVNFGPRDSVPVQFARRLLYQHNPDITLMRTSVSECHSLGKQIAEKLKAHIQKPDMARVFIPLGGISMLSTKEGPYYDEAADKALFDAVIQGLTDSDIAVVKYRRAINDDGFSTDMAKTLMHFMEKDAQNP